MTTKEEIPKVFILVHLIGIELIQIIEPLYGAAVAGAAAGSVET